MDGKTTMNEKVTLIDRKYKLKQKIDTVDRMCSAVESSFTLIDETVNTLYNTVVIYNADDTINQLQNNIIQENDVLIG